MEGNFEGCRKSLNHQPESPNSLEVDEPLVHICVNQLHANPLAYVDTFETMHQFPFDRRIKQADPRAFGGCASDDGIEPFPDS